VLLRCWVLFFRRAALVEEKQGLCIVCFYYGRLFPAFVQLSFVIHVSHSVEWSVVFHITVRMEALVDARNMASGDQSRNAKGDGEMSHGRSGWRRGMKSRARVRVEVGG
jgi:hypothetical protein